MFTCESAARCFLLHPSSFFFADLSGIVFCDEPPEIINQPREQTCIVAVYLLRPLVVSFFVVPG